MEVEDVETIVVGRDLGERFANYQKWRDSRSYCLVRITADEYEGWGECWGPVAGNREIIEETVAPWLEGRDVRNVESIHDELRYALRTSFHTFTPTGVISAIDMGLWDILGKARGEPISRLLGARRRNSVRAYATGGFFRDVDEFDRQREIVTDEVRSHVAAGFDAVKMKVGLAGQFRWGVEEDIELVRSVREAIGDDVRLMVDANWAYDIAEAERVGRRLADFDVHFFEEPIRPQHVDGYAQIARNIDTPLAGGESWAFLEEFRDVLDRDAVGYLQPDVTSAGGITSMRRIVAAAEAAGVQVYPHVFGTAVAVAASLQTLATVPGKPILEFDRTENPIRDELSVTPFENDGPVVHIPDRPGLGIEIDEEAVDQFRA